MNHKPTKTELDTFKVMANVDFVDWSRATKLTSLLDDDDGGDAPNVVIEEASAPPTAAIPVPASETQADDDDRRSEEQSDKQETDAVEHHRRFEQDDVEPEAKPYVEEKTPLEQLFNTQDYASASRHEEEEEEPQPRSLPPPEPERRHSVVDSPRYDRPLPKPKRKYTPAEENEDYEVLAEKEAVLQDILQAAQQNSSIKLTRKWDVNLHTLDELQFEFDRIQSELDAVQMVEMGKAGIKFGIGGLEAFLKRTGFSSVDGWHSESCKDMSKYNRPLMRIYKRYYRKTSMSPLMELGYLMFGTLAYTMFQNYMGMRKKSSHDEPSSSPPPRASAWEPPSAATASTNASSSSGGPTQSGPPKMRPPTAAGSIGPRWTSSIPAPAAAEQPVAPPAPQQAATSEVKEVLSSVTSQNANILKLLESMAQTNAALVAAQQQQTAAIQQQSATIGAAVQQSVAGALASFAASSKTSMELVSTPAAARGPSSPSRLSVASSKSNGSAKSSRSAMRITMSKKHGTATARRRAIQANVLDL